MRAVVCALVAAVAGAFGCDERKPAAASVVDAGASPEPSASEVVAAPIVEPSASRVAVPVYAGNGPCPPDMARVGASCVDRYEAPNEKGEYPLVMESAVTAERWCAARGKRLCMEDEWERACAGPSGFAYPYGNTHEDARCADERVWIEKDESQITMWPEKPAMGEVTRLYQAEKSGTRDGCVSGYGVRDMTGNVEEWVVSTRHAAANADRAPGGRRAYEHVLKGCYWSGCYGGSKPTCTSTNAAHADTFKFYETGFRCCKDARVSR